METRATMDVYNAHPCKIINEEAKRQTKVQSQRFIKERASWQQTDTINHYACCMHTQCNAVRSCESSVHLV